MKISAKNLIKSYDKKIILDNISFDINGVKAVGIIGESGCGKSTLLRQLSGIEMSDSGSITLNNNEIKEDNLKEYQDKIGYVFQKHNLFPHLTIKENVMLILEKIKGYDKENAMKRTNEVLNEFHLLEIKDKIPSKISGGQAQRSSIARAIATYPEVLFLDEPTAALDPLLTKEVLDSIEMLKKKGAEFVFVTHEMKFLKDFADYFMFMDKGRIIEHGNIAKLNNPQSEKLKKFMNR